MEENAQGVLQELSSLINKNGANNKIQTKCSEQQAALNRLLSQIEKEETEVKGHVDLWKEYERAKEELENMVTQCGNQIDKLGKADISAEKNLNGAIEECKVGL